MADEDEDFESDVDALANAVHASASLSPLIEDPRFGTFSEGHGEEGRYSGEVVFRGEDVGVEFVVARGALPTSLPTSVQQTLLRLPELFKKSRVLLRRWFSREENCHIVYDDDSEDEWLDVSVAMDNLALDSLQSEEEGVWVLSFFVYDGGGWYDYEPGYLFVTLEPNGTMSLDAY